MTKVFEAKIARQRELLTKQLTADEIDIEVLQRAVSAYCSLLPDYWEELKDTVEPAEVSKRLQQEEDFARHAKSSLDNLKSIRRKGLLDLAQGKKAKSKY